MAKDDESSLSQSISVVSMNSRPKYKPGDECTFGRGANLAQQIEATFGRGAQLQQKIEGTFGRRTNLA